MAIRKVRTSALCVQRFGVPLFQRPQWFAAEMGGGTSGSFVERVWLSYGFMGLDIRHGVRTKKKYKKIQSHDTCHDFMEHPI